MKSYTSYSIMALAGICMFLQIVAAQEIPDRTRRPVAQKVPRVELPGIQKTRLKDGLAIWLVEQHELPIVALNLVLQTGADHDPLDKPGIATMTAEVLDAGTKTMDALQISEKLEFIGASLTVRSNFDGTFVNLVTLTKHFDEAIGVFADVVAQPTFPLKEFERLKKQRLTALLQQRDRAATIASLSFNHIIYGFNHPYGNDPSGTEKSLNAMTRDDLVTFYTTYYRPNNATLIIVGDVTLKEIIPKLEKGFEQWTPGEIPSLQFASVPKTDAQRVYLIDKPGAPQSEIRIGYPALARTTPDFFPVIVMNRLLGGQFSSRLNMNLRERRGFTYGARSSFTFNKQPGPFVASGGVTTAKTDSSIREFLYEIDRMHREGVTADELEFSKKGLSGSFALSFETPGQIAGALQNIVLYNLPENYYETYLHNIDKVSLDDVRRVTSAYLETSKMAVVVVGDNKIIKGGVEKLHLGEIVLCDVEGNKLAQ